MIVLNPLNANPTKWSDTLEQFVGKFLSAFDHFEGLALKGLTTTFGALRMRLEICICKL